MVFFIISGILSVVFLLAVNITITSEKLKLYEYIIRAICSVALACSFMFSYKSNAEPSAAVFLLVSGLLILPQIFATDFVQYLKNKNDIRVTKKIINRNLISMIGMILLLIAAIYCYYAFPVITVH